MESIKITKIKDGRKDIVNDLLAEEIPFTINIDGEELVTLLCSPEDLYDLVLGFLFTSGIIKKPEDIKKIILNTEQWIAAVKLCKQNISRELIFKRLYTSGCGRGTLFYNMFDISNRTKLTSSFKVKSDLIMKLMINFQKQSSQYLKTAGTHSAALANKKNILIFREDIGRHNAIDKVIGAGLKQNITFTQVMLLSSGRISSEVLLKTQKCRIPVIISRSAPTNQAVKLARDLGLTLVGFVRGRRMNVYSQGGRIIHG